MALSLSFSGCFSRSSVSFISSCSGSGCSRSIRSSSVVSWGSRSLLRCLLDLVRSECDLPPAPLEGCKIRSFLTGLDADDQPSLSYQFPIGDASADILVIWTINFFDNLRHAFEEGFEVAALSQHAQSALLLF